jgi:hypothetical protein
LLGAQHFARLDVTTFFCGGREGFFLWIVPGDAADKIRMQKSALAIDGFLGSG